MAFTTATITHTFHNADSTPASGSITFRLSKRMTNGTTTLVPAEITSNLDASGNLSQALASNVDAATVPQDAQWIVTLRITGDSQAQYSIVVPAGGGTVDLGSLLPQDTTGG